MLQQLVWQQHCRTAFCTQAAVSKLASQFCLDHVTIHCLITLKLLFKVSKRFLFDRNYDAKHLQSTAYLLPLLLLLLLLLLCFVRRCGHLSN
jgi:hypothetical protein